MKIRIKMIGALLIILCLSSSILSASEVVRAAIDFGSGAVKIQSAVIDLDSNRMIGSPLLATYTPLSLTEDVAAHQGTISQEM